MLAHSAKWIIGVLRCSLTIALAMECDACDSVPPCVDRSRAVSGQGCPAQGTRRLSNSRVTCLLRKLSCVSAFIWHLNWRTADLLVHHRAGCRLHCGLLRVRFMGLAGTATRRTPSPLSLALALRRTARCRARRSSSKLRLQSALLS